VVNFGRPPDDIADARARLEQLFDESYDSVYRYCLARCGSRVLAEDIAAEVFAELARRFGQGNVEPLSEGWLITVARRRLIDHWRSTDRHRRRLERVAAMAGPNYVETWQEPDEVVLAALGSLPARQRLALTLRYLDDLSVQEVADVLECRYQAAESLLARGRRSFAKAYEALS
jgi:RNA polymerase sigma-70 factor (ECF subfamily)